MDVLLAMNLQNSYFSPSGSIYMGEKAEILRVRLMGFLAEYSYKKIFFREVHAVDDDFFVNDKTHSIATSEDAKIFKDFNKHADIFFDKIRYSAFYKTDFDLFLKKNSIKSVGIIGVEIHTSILFTAEELRNRGYRVTIIEPCVMSRDDYLADCAINLMKNSLGVMISNG